MLTCRDVTRLVSESLDRELPPLLRFRLRLHLVLCLFCRRFERQMLALRALAREVAAGEADGPGLPEAAKERIRGRLRGEQAQP
ncbi:MAG TPA: zf-HC2 domain-containing protein [Candidatus Sumerlaeota bacterium]|nr:MAG: hypothetical protein BWZ08_00552 [candidate division BRC1 bacterium ADurb.BinA292]HOE96397.1 zf-HC2 domain-containing protein [Candidatus Sumerlaeota bacterium]HOR28101.1 zf-HC2 domain-containing protein [Candidatus Sumerlaeota bacterium]HPK02015.1 zf-HC2 domain-containing protein [Candidatus Sumerlaeota bacterium]